MIEFVSTIVCPNCGHRKTETMPTDSCRFFYDCEGCRALLKPEAGDCCVFCSYGTVPCPPAQDQDQAPDGPRAAGPSRSRKPSPLRGRGFG